MSFRLDNGICIEGDDSSADAESEAEISAVALSYFQEFLVTKYTLKYNCSWSNEPYDFEITLNNFSVCNNYYILFTAPWTLFGTTRVSWYQKGKTSKLKPIWIYWSKR